MIKTQGQRIREIREAADLSLRELAKKLDVSPAFLSDVELGRRYASEKMLVQLSHLLGASLEDLKSHDTRPPVEEVKRLTAEDPAFGLAFRRVMDKNISAEELTKELLKLADRTEYKDKKR